MSRFIMSRFIMSRFIMSCHELCADPCHRHRADPEKRQYTGALVGLGYDPATNRPLLPDHDSELTFEVEIDQEDIVNVSEDNGILSSPANLGSRRYGGQKPQFGFSST